MEIHYKLLRMGLTVPLTELAKSIDAEKLRQLYTFSSLQSSSKTIIDTLLKEVEQHQPTSLNLHRQ